MFQLYVGSEKIMTLSYKPSIGDTIRDDDTDRWYRVITVDKRTVYARETADPRRDWFDINSDY